MWRRSHEQTPTPLFSSATTLGTNMNINENNTASQLNASFVKALGELRNVAKNAVNPHFKNRYASLDAILDDVRPIMASNGLGISQEPLFEDGKAGVVTRIIHKSGETRESTLLLPLKDQSAQGVGSALTYAKRYAISSILGITADDDDDGEIASKPPVKVEKPVVKKQEVKELPQSVMDMLQSMMDTDKISPEHIMEFLIAKKAVKDRSVRIWELSEPVMNRLIEKWDDVKAFKPIL